ncbi:MAG: LLM class F420-dependent oxidoreductase [Candidatus Bathyarchaeia archaeon]
MVKFGVQHPSFTYDGKNGAEIFETVKKRAKFAEENGFDSFWVMDHFFQIPHVGSVDEPMLESWTAISALSQVTDKIRLGTMVTGNVYRNPCLLAKMAANVDCMSKGRLFMGIGAGWFETEAKAFGIPFYTVPERIKRLGEAVQIIRGMWTSKGFSFQGKYYQVKDALCVPAPMQKPHPPILMGGSGEHLTLRMVARYADACNLFGGAKTVRAKLEALRKHCKAVGRNYDEILKSSLGHLVIGATPEEVAANVRRDQKPGQTDEQYEDSTIYGTPEQVIAKIQQLLDVGIQYVMLNFDFPNEEKALRLFAKEVMPEF